MPNYKSPRNKPESEFLTGKVSYSLSDKCQGDEVYSGTISYVDILGPLLHVWNIEASLFWRLSLLYSGEKSLVMCVPVLL